MDQERRLITLMPGELVHMSLRKAGCIVKVSRDRDEPDNFRIETWSEEANAGTLPCPACGQRLGMAVTPIQGNDALGFLRGMPVFISEADGKARCQSCHQLVESMGLIPAQDPVPEAREVCHVILKAEQGSRYGNLVVPEGAENARLELRYTVTGPEPALDREGPRPLEPSDDLGHDLLRSMLPPTEREAWENDRRAIKQASPPDDPWKLLGQQSVLGAVIEAQQEEWRAVNARRNIAASKPWFEGLSFEEVHAMLLNGRAPGSSTPRGAVEVPAGFMQWLADRKPISAEPVGEHKLRRQVKELEAEISRLVALPAQIAVPLSARAQFYPGEAGLAGPEQVTRIMNAREINGVLENLVAAQHDLRVKEAENNRLRGILGAIRAAVKATRLTDRDAQAHPVSAGTLPLTAELLLTDLEHLLAQVER